MKLDEILNEIQSITDKDNFKLTIDVKVSASITTNKDNETMVTFKYDKENLEKQISDHIYNEVNKKYKKRYGDFINQKFENTLIKFPNVFCNFEF